MVCQRKALAHPTKTSGTCDCPVDPMPRRRCKAFINILPNQSDMVLRRNIQQVLRASPKFTSYRILLI